MRKKLLACIAVCTVAALGRPASVEADGLRDLPALDATRTRPLFSPTRRPPAPVGPNNAAQVAMPVAPPVPPPSFRLSGVVVGSDRRVAIVKRMQGLKPISLEVGSEIDGWTVAEILPRAITLRRAERTVTLGLREP